MLLLEQDTTKKRQIDKNAIKLDDGNKNGEYKVEII